MFSSLLNAWRSWKNARGVAALAIVALAIGIGSTTAIYSVVHAVLLKPLPFEQGERFSLVLGAWKVHPGWWTVLSYPDAMDYATANQTADAFGCSTYANFNVTFNGQPVRVLGSETSSSLLRSFGVSPTVGRMFGDPIAKPSEASKVVLSGALWRHQKRRSASLSFVRRDECRGNVVAFPPQ